MWQYNENVSKICLLECTLNLWALFIIIVVNECPCKTKIGTEIAHVTRDSYTNVKVKR